MRVDIVVPTYNRPEKLYRCLKSIEKQSYKNYECCVIINDQSFESTKILDRFDFDHFWYKIPPCNLYVAGAWNYYFSNFFGKRNPDAVLWLVDDVEVLSYTIQKAVDCMITNFPDTDGVVGLKQECPGNSNYTFKWYGQVLLGNKFIQRYAPVNYKVCCPMYKHWFQDEEMYNFAKSLNKFKECPEALIYHYHPAFKKDEMDETHSKVRGSIKTADTHFFNERKSKGLNWGNSWEL